MLIWPSLRFFGKYYVYIYFGQVTQWKAHALSAKDLCFETQSKTQSKWV